MFLSKYTFILKMIVTTHSIMESILKMHKQQMIAEKKLKIKYFKKAKHHQINKSLQKSVKPST